MNSQYLCRSRGFTLVEIAFVLVIAGLMLGMATIAWKAMRESRQMEAARSHLDMANNCLLRYALHSGKVPPHSPYYTDSCEAKDAWGVKIQYEKPPPADSAQSIDATLSVLTLRNDSGDHGGVAWILISFGPNRQQDYVRSGAVCDFTSGDDIYAFVTANELYQLVTQ